MGQRAAHARDPRAAAWLHELRSHLDLLDDLEAQNATDVANHSAPAVM